MKWWVQTRGRDVDYRFLGTSGDPRRWWDPYLRLSVPEDPMLVVETQGTGWRFYATAMSSGRHDGAAPPRPIRNSVMVEGGASDAALLGALITSFFDGSLERELRAILSKDLVEAVLVEGITDAAAARIAAALIGLHADVPSTARDGIWTGGVSSPGARRGLAESARHAAQAKKRGVFASLNLMSDPDEATSLTTLRDTAVAVLLFEGGTTTLEQAPAPRKRTSPNPTGAGPSPGATATGSRKQSPPQMPWLLLILLLGGVGILLFIFARRLAA